MFVKPFARGRACLGRETAAHILREQISCELSCRAFRPCYGEDEHGFDIGAAPVAGTVDGQCVGK